MRIPRTALELEVEAMLTALKRKWCEGHSELIILFIFLNFIPLIAAVTSGRQGQMFSPYPQMLAEFAVSSFLAWRVWLGGMTSWAILFALTLWGMIFEVLSQAWRSPVLYFLMITSLAQIAILLSPGVRGYLGPGWVIRLRRDFRAIRSKNGPTGS